jgi:nicotinamidase-related amidase
MTNFGVEGTGRAADERGYDVTFIDDAMASISTEGPSTMSRS